jgi:transposase InsO family protein
MTDFVLDALEQAIHDRCTAATGDLVHHRARHAVRVDALHRRLADAGIEPSVGSRGDSYDTHSPNP